LVDEFLHLGFLMGPKNETVEYLGEKTTISVGYLWDNSPTSPAQILRLCTHFHRAFLKKDKVCGGRSWRRQGLVQPSFCHKWIPIVPHKAVAEVSKIGSL
jgi:hypothetical protein